MPRTRRWPFPLRRSPRRPALPLQSRLRRSLGATPTRCVTMNLLQRTAAAALRPHTLLQQQQRRALRQAPQTMRQMT